MANLELRGLQLLRTLDNSLERQSIPDQLVAQLSVDLLNTGKYQPRKQFDEAILNELANSIKVQGIIQPLIVRKTAEGSYEIIAGERRWRAAKQAGLKHVPVIIRNIADNIALAFSLIENIQRENLNPMEEAMAFERFREEFGMTHEDIARMIGRSRVSVTNMLRLLTLEHRVRDFLNESKLDMGHARALLTLSHEQQFVAACTVVEKQLNVRETEALVNRLKALNIQEKKEEVSINKHHKKCEEWRIFLSKQLSMNISVNVNTKGKGLVILEINSASEMERLLEGMSRSIFS